MKPLKILCVGVLLILTVISVSFYLNAAATVIKAKGKAKAYEVPGGIVFGCDNTDNVDCTITIPEG